MAAQQKRRSAFLLALAVGAGTGMAFVLVFVGAIMMVMGDGTAPAATHLMLSLADIPRTVLGTSRDSMLVVAAFFWGGCAAVAAYVFLLLFGLGREAP